MTVEVEGLKELKRNLDLLDASFGKEIKSALISGGLLVETQAKKNIRDQSFGTHVIRYRKGGRKKNHIAAKPGESPNTDTGALIRSISTEVKPDSVFVGTSLEYAPWLEFGTINNPEGNPFLLKALNAKQDKINSLFADAVKNAMLKVLKVK
jgi:phage gpG-like protein